MAEPAAPTLVLDVSMQGTPAVQDEATFAQQVLAGALRLQQHDLPAGAHTVYLSVVWADEAAIADLNRTYRAIDSPTDVLSFPQLEPGGAAPPDAPLMLGDIVVSLPRATAQAAEYGHSYRRELGFLLVHGLLHLLGYDHEDPSDAAIMEERQEAIMRALDLPRDVEA